MPLTGLEILLYERREHIVSIGMRPSLNNLLLHGRPHRGNKGIFEKRKLQFNATGYVFSQVMMD